MSSCALQQEKNNVYQPHSNNIQQLYNSTVFLIRKIDKYTWTYPVGKTHKETDHILIHRTWNLSIIDVRSFR